MSLRSVAHRWALCVCSLMLFLGPSVFAQVVEVAKLRPDLVWQRTSPPQGSVEGPVVYQLFVGAGTPGTIPRFDSNFRHLVNSDITDNGGVVAIGGMSVNANTGIITFAGGQAFPGAGGSGTVTSVTGGTGLTGGTITSSGTLALDTTYTDGRYLQLSGGTLTGALGGTSAAFSGTVQAASLLSTHLSSSTGQALTVNAGDGSGNGGALTVRAGNAGVGSGGAGGDVNLTAGSAVPQGGVGYANQGPAGKVNITAGGGYNGVGGNVNITSGPNSNWSLSALGTHSSVVLAGGTLLGGDDGASLTVEGAGNGSNSNAALSFGGNVRITSGNGHGGDAGGSIILTPGSPSGNVQVVGNLSVTGTVSKGGGSFKIDHPLDPANKYLSHSFVESPDMMDIYNGNVVLDGRGRAWVSLPDWFDALNMDFRYQLTAIGNPGQHILYVAKEIANNRFQIAGGRPYARVSWQVTGIRHDAYANAHRIQVEEDKGDLRGSYLHPELFEKQQQTVASAKK